MTISSVTNKSGPYDCNGVTTDFTGEFRITDETHVQVIHADSDGNETTLDLEAGDYSVSGVGDDQFTVTISPALADGTITLLLDVPFTQSIDLENQGAYQAEVVERGFDLGVQRDKMLQEQVDRSVKLPASADSSELDALVQDISRLGNSADNIDTLAGITGELADVAGNASDISTVAGIAASVAGVAAVAGGVTAVAAIAAGVTAVAAIAAAVSTVAGIAAAVSAVAAMQADVSTVAGIDGDVTTVAGIAADVTTVAGMGGVASVQNQINAGTDDDPTDDDFFTFRDTATGNLFKRSWGNLRTLLRTYFDGLYQPVGVTGGQVPFIVNGSFAVSQFAAGTTDNSYVIDGWRLLLEAANAATAVKDTADVPNGAGYALKLTVGSGNNNKFGVFGPIESKDTLPLRGTACSLRVPLKATAGLVDGAGKIRIGVAQFTGTADAISSDPVSAWGAEGTNPTLATNWSWANVPAANAVTTSWADYLIENVSISSGAKNLAIVIWSDDKTNTAGTDILRIGGYVTLATGTKAQKATILPYEEELRRCQRYFCKSYDDGTAPGTATYLAMVSLNASVSGVGVFSAAVQFPTPMRVAPTVSYWDGAGGASVCSYTTTSGATFTDGAAVAIAPTNISTRSFVMVGNGTTGRTTYIHYTADARL